MNEAITILSEITNNVEREIYIPMVSKLSSINIDFIRRELDKKLDGKSVESDIVSGLSRVSNPTLKSKIENEEPDSSIVIAEKYVLYSLIHSKPYAHFKQNAEFLFSGVRKEIYNLIEEKRQSNFDSNLIQSVFEEYENKSVIADIVNFSAKTNEGEEQEIQYYKDCLTKIYRNYLVNLKDKYLEERSREIDNIKRDELAKIIREIENKKNNINLEEL